MNAGEWLLDNWTEVAATAAAVAAGLAYWEQRKSVKVAKSELSLSVEHTRQAQERERRAQASQVFGLVRGDSSHERAIYAIKHDESNPPALRFELTIYNRSDRPIFDVSVQLNQKTVITKEGQNAPPGLVKGGGSVTLTKLDPDVGSSWIGDGGYGENYDRALAIAVHHLEICFTDITRNRWTINAHGGELRECAHGECRIIPTSPPGYRAPRG